MLRFMAMLIWAEKLSGSQIAERLGVTRNAVLGAVHRFKLTPRAIGRKRNYPHGIKKTRPTQQSAATGITAVAPLLPLVITPVWLKRAPISGRVSIVEVEECRFATDMKDGVYLFCNVRRHGTSSYCEFHHLKVTESR